MEILHHFQRRRKTVGTTTRKPLARRFELLEDRVVLSVGDPIGTVTDAVHFETLQQSMWGPGGPAVIDTGTLFSGIDWDVNLHPTLGDDTSNLFIALDAATTGKVGFDFRALLDPGSVDASFAGDVSLEAIRGDGDLFTINSQLLGTPAGRLVTRSPNIDIESNFVFELAANLNIRGEIGTPDITITVPTVSWKKECANTIFGQVCISVPVFGSKQVTIPGVTLAAFNEPLLDFGIATQQQLLKLTNNPANPEFSILGIDLVDAKPGGNLAVTFEMAFDPLAPPFFDVAVKDENNPKAEKDHNVNPFDAGVEFSMGDITLEAATLFLEDTSYSGGVLAASGAANLARFDIDADFLASILFGLPPLGASAGLSVAGFDIASFSYDLLDVDVGPQFSVSQDFQFVPELWVDLNFDQLVVIAGQQTTQHSMPVGTTLDVSFAGASTGGTLNVEPTYYIKNQFSNSTELLVAPFVDALALGASVDTFLGTLFDDALFDFDPIVGTPITLATIFDQTYTLSGFAGDPGQTLSVVFNQPPAIDSADLLPSATTIDEGSPLNLSGAFSDPDLDQTHTVVIDWNDGSAATTVSLPAGVHDFRPVAHTYADDASTPRTITVTVTDEFGATGDATIDVNVVNVAPTLVLSGDATVDEGSPFALNLTASDPGDDTIDHWTIDWNDGTPAEIVSGNETMVSHTFADGTNAYTVTATATDEDGTFPATDHTVTVNNVAPTLAFAGPNLNLDAAGNPVSFSAVQGQPLGFLGTITDLGFDNLLIVPNTFESFTFAIVWGDATADTISAAAIDAAGSPGAATRASFAANHVYASHGSYTIEVTVLDDDGGETIVTQAMTVEIAALQQPQNTAAVSSPATTDLAVGGTLGNDKLHFAPGAGDGEIEVKLAGASLGVFNPTGRLIAFAQAGDDDVQVAGSIGLPAWIYGGPGADRIKGGAGHDLLFGGDHADLLVGGEGRDLIVGGDGPDRLVGNSDDDILIGGTTAFDDQQDALAAIISEWTSARSYATRLDAVSGTGNDSGFDTRSNANYFLKSDGADATVFDDADEDVLTGSAGTDWFFAELSDSAAVKDRITDLKDEAFADDLSFILSGPLSA